MEETLKIIHTREVAEATFYSTFNNLLEQAKNNPDMLLNIPYENILNLEKNLEEMTKRHEAGSINSEYEINLLKEFLTLYKKTSLKNEINWRLETINNNYNYTINCIKEKYGDGIEATLNYCAKLTDHTDEIIRKTRFIILALKLHPTKLGYYSRNEMEWIVPKLQKLYEIEKDENLFLYINLLEEFIHLEHYIHSYCNNDKLDVCYTDQKDILYENGFIAVNINGEASIIHYIGTNNEIEIPEVIEGISVKLINNFAFCAKSLKQVTFHSSITKIGDNAFARCGLTQIELPEKLAFIGNDAFSNNKLGNITIPQSVNVIGKESFQGNKLISVRIPAGISYIPESAFQWNKLISVEIEEGVTNIEHGAFYGNCIEKITIPNSVTSISSSVFMSNPLNSITLPANIEFDEWGCVDGDLTEAYERNNKKAGVYTCKIETDESGLNEGNWRYSPDVNQFNNWEIKAHEEMEDLAIRQAKAIKQLKMSNEGMRLSSLQTYFRNPFPKEIWEEMPDDFREYIRREIKNGQAFVCFNSKPAEALLEKSPLLRMKNFDTITVSYGPLAARGYNARTGECVWMS